MFNRQKCFCKRFGNGGGVTNAVLKSIEEAGLDPSQYKVEKCSGADECKKHCCCFEQKKLNADFIEGMMCEGGCVGGPSQHKTEAAFKKDRDKMIGEADERGVRENLENYPMDLFSMYKK